MPDDITPVEELPQPISINGVDYDPTELQSFIDKGKQTIDLEKQWNTPVDRVWPEYGQTRETLKTTSAERDQYKQELEQFKNKQNAGTDTPTDLREAQDAARRLGITLKEDLDKEGYIKKDDLDKYLSERDQMTESKNRILAKADELEKEIDGSDGRPAFNKRIVLAYAAQYRIPDLKEAYEDMHKPQLQSWQKEQVNSQRSKPLKTLGSGGAKEPRTEKITDDNVSDSLKEALWGGSE